MVVSVLGYGALTTGAIGPGFGPVSPESVSAPVAVASLTRSGTDVIITGSVEGMFKNGGFVGPNRTEKQDRQRISVDALAFTKAFEKSRTRLAALRNPPSVPSDTRVASIDPKSMPGFGPGFDPSIGTAALTAINAVAPDQTMPLPVMASQQLAYARANEPVTTDFTPQPEAKYSEKELWCLATAIYFEARGEIYRGQVAVAQVVMNRTKHKLYPSTICGVVFQNENKRNACQFSFACDGRPETITDQTAWTQAQDIATKVASGELYLPEVSNATHYHASYVYPDWAPRMKKVTKIGLHVFYRFKHGWSFG